MELFYRLLEFIFYPDFKVEVGKAHLISQASL